MTVFAALFVPDELRAAVSGRAWLEGMLEAERALANAGAIAGVVPPHLATEIADACDADHFDIETLAVQGREVGNPAEPLVRALVAAIGENAARYVHRGATSQDVMDSAAMLVARRALRVVLEDLDRAAAGCAALARAHRSTPMAARTLLQQAVPTTFGLKAAGWLVALLEARMQLERIQRERLVAQLGGAAGTLAAFGEEGVHVLELYAHELDLAVPTVPWHTNRVVVADLGAALSTAAGVAAKIALDVALLAQTEVAEVAERADGRSSTMPQKRNPVGSALARAAAQAAVGYASVLAVAVVQEHERAVGSWQAEWEALSGALAYAGGALHAIAGALEGLDVDVERMRHNLDLTGGLVVAARIAFLLTDRLDRSEAQRLVRAAATRAAAAGGSLRDELVAEPAFGLTQEELDDALDPSAYLGSAEAFVDRALALYEGRA